MKHKTDVKKVNVGTPVWEEDETETVELEEPEAQPVKVSQVPPVVYRVKCIWSSSVKVAASKTPSGAAYEFQPLEEKPVTSKADMLYLTGLTRGQSGCCGSTGEKRHYFELV